MLKTRKKLLKQKPVNEKLLLNSDLADLQNLVKIGSWTFEFATSEVKWSEELFRIFELDPAKGPPSWPDGHKRFYHPDDWQRSLDIIEKAIAAGESYSLENRIIRVSDGSVIYTSVRGFPRRSQDGRITGYIGTVHDITEYKQVEDSLRENERKLSIFSKIGKIFLLVTDDNMFGDVLQVMLDATGSKYGVFGYLDEDGALVCPSMTRDVWEECNIPDKSIRYPRETWGNSIWGRAIIEKRSFYKNEPGIVPEGHIPIDNVLVAPILFHDHVIGHFELANRIEGYSDTERILVEEICTYIAPVLNARLERDLSETERKKAEEELKQKVQKLERMNQFMVDRETKMIELKREINLLLTESGRAEKYEAPEKVDSL
ncbi:MAG: PAS domain-containing protein [Deltaproteobacteria bacterium]|nr:PAS domain-containing protein [Candidatus Desulfobacula maris]